MGITYRAQDLTLGSLVALKVITARYSEDSESRERFRREARAAAQLRHPNVAGVFHFGETDTGRCFYAMELIEGETVEAYVRRNRLIPPYLALEVAERAYVLQTGRTVLEGPARELRNDPQVQNIYLGIADGRP